MFKTNNTSLSEKKRKIVLLRGDIRRQNITPYAAFPLKYDALYF